MPVTGRRAIQPGLLQEMATPDSRTPSKTEAGTDIEGEAGLIVERYGEGLEVDAGLTEMGLGTFIHRCFEVLGAKPDLKKRITQITGVVIEPDELEKITAAVGQFETWMETYFNTKSVLHEWPVLAFDNKGCGCIWNGRPDCGNSARSLGDRPQVRSG